MARTLTLVLAAHPGTRGKGPAASFCAQCPVSSESVGGLPRQSVCDVLGVGSHRPQDNNRGAAAQAWPACAQAGRRSPHEAWATLNSNIAEEDAAPNRPQGSLGHRRS